MKDKIITEKFFKEVLLYNGFEEIETSFRGEVFIKAPYRIDITSNEYYNCRPVSPNDYFHIGTDDFEEFLNFIYKRIELKEPPLYIFGCKLSDYNNLTIETYVQNNGNIFTTIKLHILQNENILNFTNLDLTEENEDKIIEVIKLLDNLKGNKNDTIA